MKRLVVDHKDVGKRLDQFVVEQLDQIEELSRATVQKLIAQGLVLVNKFTQKTGYKLKSGDKVTVDYSEKEVVVPDIDLPIIYEDEDCLVINKPAGVLVHSKGSFNPETTVATFLNSRIKGLTGNRAGIVHRLDRATSGVMICAKTPEALSWLQKQFSTRKVKKEYIAVVEGNLEPSKAVIDMPIERNPKLPQTFRTGSNGKAAKTIYKVLDSKNGYSLVELKPETGRTHQLRVHLQKLGHSIVGDELYGGTSAERLLLHAKKLEITTPDHQRRTFEAPLPPVFNKYMA